MESKPCKRKPKNKVIIEGFRDYQVCTWHLADKHLQHLITMKIATTERIDDLEGICEAGISTRGKPQENSP